MSQGSGLGSQWWDPLAPTPMLPTASLSKQIATWRERGIRGSGALPAPLGNDQGSGPHWAWGIQQGSPRALRSTWGEKFSAQKEEGRVTCSQKGFPAREPDGALPPGLLCVSTPAQGPRRRAAELEAGLETVGSACKRRMNDDRGHLGPFPFSPQSPPAHGPSPNSLALLATKATFFPL